MRSPFFMYFSARSASWAPLLFQQMTRCHSVFSCFSPPCPVHCRLVASERFATREPLVVLRTSGSAPKFPISMTLFRLRLTTDLQTMGGRGPRASTVYESQVILSIKDTPLGLKFCRYPGGRNTGPENHRVFHRPPIVARPAAHGCKPQALIQPACCGVRFAHLEVNDPHPPVAQLLEQPLHQRSSDTAAPLRRGDAQVQDLPFVRREVRHRVARDVLPPDGDKERCLGGEALAEIVGRPGIREDRALDRRDGRHVSRLGGTTIHWLGREGVIELARRAGSSNERQQRGGIR